MFSSGTLEPKQQLVFSWSPGPRISARATGLADNLDPVAATLLRGNSGANRIYCEGPAKRQGTSLAGLCRAFLLLSLRKNNGCRPSHS